MWCNAIKAGQDQGLSWLKQVSKAQFPGRAKPGFVAVDREELLSGHCLSGGADVCVRRQNKLQSFHERECSMDQVRFLEKKVQSTNYSELPHQSVHTHT